MGFPSPAADYAESPLTVNSLCNFDANCSAIETSDGYAVINRSFKPAHGRQVLIEYQGKVSFAVVNAGTLVTDSEVFEGEALDEVNVLGVVTFLIKRTFESEDVTPF